MAQEVSTFNIRTAIRVAMKNRSYYYPGLMKVFERIHRKHLRDIPSDYRATDIFALALKRGWIKADQHPHWPRYIFNTRQRGSQAKKKLLAELAKILDSDQLDVARKSVTSMSSPEASRALANLRQAVALLNEVIEIF